MIECRNLRSAAGKSSSVVYALSSQRCAMARFGCCGWCVSKARVEHFSYSTAAAMLPACIALAPSWCSAMG